MLYLLFFLIFISFKSYIYYRSDLKLKVKTLGTMPIGSSTIGGALKMAVFDNREFVAYKKAFPKELMSLLPKTIKEKIQFMETIKFRYHGGLEEGRSRYALLNKENYEHILSQPHYQYPLRWNITGKKRDPIYLEYRKEYYNGPDFSHWEWAKHPCYMQFIGGATDAVWTKLRPFIRVSVKDGSKFVPVINRWRAFHWGWGLTKVLTDWYRLTGEVPYCEILGF